MKNLFFFIGLTIISFTKIHSQTFTPGYYIINYSAEYSVALPSGLDCENGFEVDDLRMNWGEVIIAFEFSKGKYYCFDPNGRLLVIQGVNCLTKAPITPGASVGKLTETVTYIDGTVLTAGSYYWIVGQNISNSTIKIMLAEGLNLDIPSNVIDLYGLSLKNWTKDQLYKKVTD
jgi:hypothetical protein